jgi:hypothetical protein
VAAGREVRFCAGRRAAEAERVDDGRACRGPVAGPDAAAAEPGVVGHGKAAVVDKLRDLRLQLDTGITGRNQDSGGRPEAALTLILRPTWNGANPADPAG